MEITEPNDSVTMSGRSCGLALPSRERADEDGAAFYYSFLPNMMLSLHPDYANWYSVWPLSADRSIVTCEWMMNPDAASGRGVQPAGRCGALAYGEPAGLAHLRDEPGRRFVAGVSSGAVLAARESIPAAWDRAYLDAMGR